MDKRPEIDEKIKELVMGRNLLLFLYNAIIALVGIGAYLIGDFIFHWEYAAGLLFVCFAGLPLFLCRRVYRRDR